MSQFAAQGSAGNLPRGALVRTERGTAPRIGARCRALLPTATLLLLAGCGDRILETGLGYDYFFGDERPPIQSPVSRISETDPTYPNLALVPPRPRSAVSPAERSTLKASLESDLTTGGTYGDYLRGDIPPPKAPPPVEITPEPQAAAPPRPQPQPEPSAPVARRPDSATGPDLDRSQPRATESDGTTAAALTDDKNISESNRREPTVTPKEPPDRVARTRPTPRPSPPPTTRPSADTRSPEQATPAQDTGTVPGFWLLDEIEQVESR